VPLKVANFVLQNANVLGGKYSKTKLVATNQPDADAAWLQKEPIGSNFGKTDV